MKGTGAKRNVCPGSCVSTGAKFPVAPVESAPMDVTFTVKQRKKIAAGSNSSQGGALRGVFLPGAVATVAVCKSAPLMVSLLAVSSLHI